MKIKSIAFSQFLLILLVAFSQWNCSKPPTNSSEISLPTALPDISFVQSSDTVEVYDFIEVVINIDIPTSQNPFKEVRVTGSFGLTEQQNGKLSVNGFCDSADGSIFRIRFMPTQSGSYAYSVTYWQDNLQKVFSGKFKAINAGHRGLIQADSNYPWHFIWKGTNEHYYLNGTTAFLLMGWEDEKVILDALNRLHSFDINRVRILLDGRSDHFWTEPVKSTESFHLYLNPWVAERPDDIENPGFNYARFNIPYWQKFERMLKYAREKDIVVSVIFGWNDTPIHPLAGSEDERRYFNYTVARLSSYSNVTWDLGDDLDSYRDIVWTHDTGVLLYELDPYHHIATSHPHYKDGPQDRSSTWFGMTSYQQWERPLHTWMLEQRQLQVKSGRIIPQVNEEYGYEDHYPKWAPYPAPNASADADRRAAWEIAMAGGYQTTGETAKRGTGVEPDTGGGWVNGRGDKSMTMLQGYAHMVHFFTGFEWWKTDPHDELVNNGAFCLAELGNLYVIYLPNGGNVTVKLEQGRYEAKWFNPKTGEFSNPMVIDKPVWASPSSIDKSDWVILIKSI